MTDVWFLLIWFVFSRVSDTSLFIKSLKRLSGINPFHHFHKDHVGHSDSEVACFYARQKQTNKQTNQDTHKAGVTSE